MQRQSSHWFTSLLASGMIAGLMVGCTPVATDLNMDSTPFDRPTEVVNFWTPSPLTRFQIQFSGDIDLTVMAEVYDLDAFDSQKETVEQLQRQGSKVICYIDAGTVEDWRSDYANYPKTVIGKVDAGWPGENWLDIRALDVLLPILEARVEFCASKGFDGVEFDNLDGYQNDTGFDLTAADQLAFNRALADLAHEHGLAAGLKNDPEQIAELAPWFEFVILESCFEQGWCELAAPFIQADKAVFDIEYTPISPHCESAAEQAITLVQKRLNLDGWIKTCQ